MTQCLRCRRVKFWFQFHSRFEGTHTATYDICKVCARMLMDRAVYEWLQANEKGAA